MRSSMFVNRVRRTGGAVLLLFLFGASACCSKKGSSKGKKVKDGKNVDLVLSADTVSSWMPKNLQDAEYKVEKPPKTYTPKNLYELLNGAADSYIEAGMVAMAFFELKDKKDKYASCQVYLYMMKDATKARALLEREKDDKFKPLKVGDAGYEDGNGALLARGRFFARVDSVPGKTGIKVCPYEAIARSIVASKSLPF